MRYTTVGRDALTFCMSFKVSHFECPLKVSYYEEGPEIKKQVVSFVWSKACQLTFEELTKCLASVPILVRPDFTKPLIWK